VRVLIAVMVVVAGGTAWADVDPDTEVARARFRAGSALYNQGEYERAIAEFEAGKKAKPLPAFDFNIARAYDRMGRWREAREAYRRYVAREPNAPDAAEVRARIEELDRRIGPASVVAQPRAEQPEKREQPSAAGRPKTIAGAVVGAVGVGLLAGGAALAVLGDQTVDQLNALNQRMGTFDPALEQQLNTDRAGEAALFAIGSAAVVTGVVLIVLGQRERARAPRLSAAVRF
jgi:tetratricopeptide (TPR) repeat protein